MKTTDYKKIDGPIEAKRDAARSYCIVVHGSYILHRTKCSQIQILVLDTGCSVLSKLRNNRSDCLTAVT